MRKILYILLTLPLFAFGQVQDSCYSVADYNLQIQEANPPITIDLASGWNMFGYSCRHQKNAKDLFANISDKIVVIKNNVGSVYLREYDYNGLGNLIPNQGYQIKMYESVFGLEICSYHINFHQVAGCTDCEANNFNQLASVDDGSCNYDSDGDGIPDYEEFVGCQDATACNYDVLATDSGECSYAQEGYDCGGNITAQIGDEIEGGYLFYLDESGSRGLVAAMEDLEGLYEWGCENNYLNIAQQTSIGSGFQNTIDITENCLDRPIAASEAFLYVGMGYDDWFLPSTEELVQIKDNIGESSNFSNDYWSSTEVKYNNNTAYKVSFIGNTIKNQDKNKRFNVRPIRAFGNWIEGCVDETACNYNSEVNLPNSTLCEYPELGYDCGGNITEYVVGMEAEGGIVFYVDETWQHGLVAAMEDLDGTYEWGCSQVLDVADGTNIGEGYQNTINIVNKGCTSYYGGVTAAQASLDADINGYSDWYLPSRDELTEMYFTIGGYNGSESNIGDFESVDLPIYWSSSSYPSSSGGTAWFISTKLYEGGYSGHSYESKRNAYRVRVVRAF